MIDIQRENQQLIALAVKCKFINTTQEQAILSHLIKSYYYNPNHSVLTVFTEKKILTPEKITSLIALRNHLKIKMLDRRFGEIGISNRFITPKHVENALNDQDALFREKRESKKIGDILVEKNEMSQADKIAILLTQDRIQDDLLEQAIYDIASSEMERTTINKRFGAIAVKHNFISIEQLNQALRLQKKGAESGRKKQYLGEILQKFFQLTQDDILFILKIQQQIEKERLSLEKAVIRYKSEISSSKRFNELFEFTISTDKMEAFIHRKKESFENMELGHFHNWLKLNGIQFGLVNNELIKIFLSDSEIGGKLKIAQGKFPTRPTDEVVQFHFDINPTGNIDIAGQNLQPQVKKGTILAKIFPHKPGEPGTNVMGHTILPAQPKMNLLQCGNGVVKKDLYYIAGQDGIPMVFKQRTLFIEPCRRDRETRALTGPLGVDTKDTYRDVDLKIEGNINAGGTVICHSLLILGNVLGRVDASRDINIKGNIGENESFIDRSNFRTMVVSGGNLNISKNIAQAKIVASRSVNAQNSNVFSSEIHALETIILNNVYSSPEYPSTLEIGNIPNYKLDAINRSIDKEIAVLRTLQKQDELDKLALKLQKYFNTQNEYLEKKQILRYLINVCNADELKHLESLGQKIQLYEPSGGTDLSDNGDAFLNNEHALAYMEEEIKQVEGLSLDQQIDYLSRQRVEVSNLCRTAANRTERYTAEYRARQKFILEKVSEKQVEIDQQKQKIETLMIQKDFLLFHKQPVASVFKPMIRVKNMVEKNTVVKGAHSSMVIKESIYGVKIQEIKDAVTGNYFISIEGYYD
ncbi:flagellar assembly protein A [uncultured Desulfobacter sp.]|uniref:flagellar assembly protein A n=1 Tax=uncultured Desulfobacter sp. TaxID=240139 RepID=UPI002AABA370|nr:flagellar assembly protein A [uncultured Desulfobacter sp.]